METLKTLTTIETVLVIAMFCALAGFIVAVIGSLIDEAKGAKEI